MISQPAASRNNTSPPQNRTRVRDNQRRARARRQDYIREIEEKLHQYERQGTQATVEVQAAAKAVVHENQRLRQENLRLTEEILELRELSSQERVDDRHANEDNVTGSDRLSAESLHKSKRRLGGDAEPPDRRGLGAVPFNSPRDDTSSCEYAAHIITSMRRDVNTDDIRSELGCGDDVEHWQSCKVDNARLFVAVDRYAE